MLEFLQQLAWALTIGVALRILWLTAERTPRLARQLKGKIEDTDMESFFKIAGAVGATSLALAALIGSIAFLVWAAAPHDASPQPYYPAPVNYPVQPPYYAPRPDTVHPYIPNPYYRRPGSLGEKDLGNKEAGEGDPNTPKGEGDPPSDPS